MKKISFIIFSSIIIAFGLIACEEDNEFTETIKKFGQPSELEIAKGLRAALEKGSIEGVKELSLPGGYANHELYRIHFPPKAQKVATKLRAIGLDQEVDKMVNLLNEAAEDAVSEAKPLFIAAISQMTIADAKGILLGSDTAATAYLKEKTDSALQAKFKPHIRHSLDQVNATRHWNSIISQYNKLPLVDKINPDLDDYVCRKAIDGLFLKVSKEEAAIRRDPAKRTSEILKKIFNYAAKEKN